MHKLDRLGELIDGAEELLVKLADAHDPRVQWLRDRVDHAVADATRTFSRRGKDAAVRLRDVAATIDEFVHDYPRIAVLTGMLVAGTVGFIAGAAAGRRRVARDAG